MKIFIIKCFFLSAFAISLYLLAQWNLSETFVNQNYPKFTHQAGSLILGISRAHDGIAPNILEENLEQFKVDKPFLNFAFHLSQSPYGPVYLEAVKKKIKKDSRNGVFILGVSVGNICIPDYTKDSPEEFSDKYSILAKVKNLNSDPNFEYIRKSFGKALYKGFTEPQTGIRVIHDDGWIEVDVQSKKFNINQKDIDKWKNQTMQSYKDLKGFYKFSKARYQSLDETISFLKNHGHVFLVRIPVDRDVLAMEKQYMPNFDSLINQLAVKNNIPYINYTNTGATFETYDGAHLSKNGAIKFTNLLSTDINEYLTRKTDGMIAEER